jgi:PAS domain S-box-containing protein
MTYLYAYGLVSLELTFIMVVIMLLHSMKSTIGNAPYYMTLGTIMVFAQVINASGLRIDTGLPGLDFNITPPVFFAPFMAALLIAYVVDGTREAQRLIGGLLGVVAVFLYLAFITDHQAEIRGYALYPEIPSVFLQNILFSTRIYILASLLSILIVFLTLPIIYQLLRNRNCRLSVSVFGALVFSQVLDAFFYELVTNYNWDNWWEALRHSYLARILSMTWVAVLTVSYLKLRDIPQRGTAEASRSTFDIMATFMGRYGQTQRLQSSVREWEGRYQMVVESSHDLIFLIDQNAAILDANKVAVQKIGWSAEDVHHIKVKGLLKTIDGRDVDWKKVWESLHADERSDSEFIDQEFIMSTRDGTELIVDALVTPLTMRKKSVAMLVARDVTERRALERESEALHTQLVHSQRMEAVGQLAGGIAHDFNNLLHAIQGSLEVLEKSIDTDQRTRQLITNIDGATNRAAELTGQLLGFARGGKYQVKQIDLVDLISETEELYRPLLGKKVTLKVVTHPDPMFVEGDFTQLQQALLNMLINARDAVAEKTDSPTVVFRAEPVTPATPGWQKPDGAKDRDYIVIRIRDNGSGMDEQTREKIFEPFFTTKDARGTGMGLAMCYGCIQNHQGWIHVISESGKGSEFFIFLPKA